jgi:hypothetical protein
MAILFRCLPKERAALAGNDVVDLLPKLHEEGEPIFQRCRWAAASASSSCSTSIISSSSLSIAAGEANDRTPCGQSGASPVSVPPLSAAEVAETLPDGDGVAPTVYRAI